MFVPYNEDDLVKMINYPHAHEYCPRCKTHKHTYHDKHHDEVFCEKCGLVIRDTSINSIYQTIQLLEYNEKRLYKLHRKRIR
jgi:hypothetical protein